MTELLRDLRFALRGLKRRPGFAAIVVLTLALGIGVNVAILSLAQTLLLRPLPFPDADRLVRIQSFIGTESGHITQREIEDLQRESESLEQVAAYYLSQYNLTGDGPPEAAPCAIGTTQLFQTLGADFVLGAPYDAVQDFIRQYRVVLTHGLWQRQYSGDPDIVGSTVILDGGSYVVDGVLAPGTSFPPGIELYRQVTEYYGLDGRRHSVVARLAPGVGLEQAQQELDGWSQRWEQQNPELNRGLRFEVVPLRDSFVGPARPYVLTLVGAVAFVLLIAIVNTVNLLLGRAEERRAEMAVRASLGAGRSQLIRQLLVESLVLASLGGGLGLLLADGWLRLLRSLVQAQLPAFLEIRLDPMALAATAALVLASGVLAGLVPALRSSRAALSHGLRAGARGAAGRRGGRLRGILVTAEIALTLVLLAGAGLMIRSFLALDQQDLGFDAKNLYTVRIDPPYWSYNETSQLIPFYEQTLPKLAQIPGVEGVAANQNLPLAGLDGETKLTVTLEGQALEEQERNPFVHLQSVNPGYFQVMAIPLRKGREFSSADREGSRPVAVISQRLAERLWPPGSVLDQRLKLGPPDSDNPWLTVVGVAGDVRSESRTGAASLDLYVSHLQHFTGDTYFAFRTPLEGPAFERQITAAIQSVDADIPLFDTMSMDGRVASVEWQRQATSHILTAFGAFALLLAAFGTYAVISYQVAQRTQEMGIRQALGARPRDLFTAVLGQGLGLFLRGTVLGVLASFILVKSIEHLLFGVNASDPVSAGIAWLILLVTLILACALPARRAAKLDPLLAIREGQQ
ncbi:MAG: ABC transporter permease [Acidobacteriota bacterium]